VEKSGFGIPNTFIFLNKHNGIKSLSKLNDRSWDIVELHSAKFITIKRPVFTDRNWPDVDDECVKNLKL